MKAQAYTSSSRAKAERLHKTHMLSGQVSAQLSVQVTSFFLAESDTYHPYRRVFHEMKERGKASHCHLPGVICLFLATSFPGRAKL